MNLLLDTNIFLEILLNQERAAEACQLLSKADEHHAVADAYMLTLVSFDSDFDHTQRGRKTPAQIV